MAIEFSLDDLFKEDVEEENIVEPLNEGDDNNEQKPSTDAVSKRINEVKEKTEKETQDKIAKDLGYGSYEEMLQAKNKKAFEDAGIDNQETIDLVEKIVQQRLANDPRFKKLEEFESREKASFVSSQLEEISKLTGTKYTSVDQLPKDTLALWEKTGNLKQAFLATEGEALLIKKQAANAKGTTVHMADAHNSGSSTKTRPLTEKEKRIYRSVMPDITEEELNAKTIEVKEK